jgi:hypothetical protein
MTNRECTRKVLCSGCGKTYETNEGEEMHECPLKSEVYNDDELCDCCPDCQYSCAMEI